MKTDELDYMTADEAKEPLGCTTREGVLYLIKTGQLPGARKLSNKLTSPWIIPTHVVKTLQKKRAQASSKA